MNKVVYIIPGFKEKVSLKGYQQAIRFFKSRKFKVIPIKISWKYKVMSDYINEFLGQLSHKKDDDVYLFGFSFGAMIALISAAKIKPKMLFLCSLSPYFKEDLRFLKKSWENDVGKKRIKDFKKFSFQDLAENISCKTLLIAGEKESKELHKRVKNAYKKMKHTKLVIADNAKHDISQKEYVDELYEIISTL